MHELEFTNNEILIILQALDLYSRIWFWFGSKIVCIIKKMRDS